MGMPTFAEGEVRKVDGEKLLAKLPGVKPVCGMGVPPLVGRVDPPASTSPSLGAELRLRGEKSTCAVSLNRDLVPKIAVSLAYGLCYGSRQGQTRFYIWFCTSFLEHFDARDSVAATYLRTSELMGRKVLRFEL